MNAQMTVPSNVLDRFEEACRYYIRPRDRTDLPWYALRAQSWSVGAG